VEAARLKANHAAQISILVGLETEHITALDLASLRDLLFAHKGTVDYIVGSVHHVNTIPIDFDLPTFQRALSSMQCDSEQQYQECFLCAYFESQFEILRQFKPEVVGHFDLCRLYTPTLQFSDYPQAQELMERNIDFAVGYGALFEVNSSAFKKGWMTAYPGEDALKVRQCLIASIATF
jgi:histidinol-phosphatase (PHP family)